MISFSDPFLKETFDEKLKRVENDLENEWPAFRKEEMSILWDYVCADVGFDDPILDYEKDILEDQFNHLNEYSKCLELMARYRPKEKDALEHERSLKEATEGTKPTDFLQFLWESFGKCTALGGPLNLRPTWVNSAIRYLVNLFNLAGVGENQGVPPLLIDLPIQSEMIPVAIHCLLMAENAFARQNSAWVYDMISSDAEEAYVEAGLEFYFNKLRNTNPARAQLFDRILVSTPGHDTWLCNVVRIFTNTVSTLGNSTWEQRKKAVLCSMGLLARHLQTEVDIEDFPAYRRWTSCVFLSNPALKTVLADNTVSASLKLSFLGDIICDHDAAKWMGNSAILMVKFFIKQGARQSEADENIFLLPVLLQVLNSQNGKRGQAEVAQRDRIKSLLAQKLRKSWKEVLDALRQTKTTARQTVIEGVIKNWSLLGSIIGVPYLVNPRIGCFNPTCPLFVVKTDSPTPRCSRCLQSQYCGVECQNNDWKAHKPHCKKLAET